ncbi:hypothetical protein V6N11_001003 [Hibiscus sabdariffa]|uniref:MO25-like protein n=1 Tax=Hibiscus sabdariffa TaxID=183260 RepID=A0ABR2RYG7_9ROSI
MKGLFKSKPRTPVEMVQLLHELLLFVLGNTDIRDKKRAEKIAELDKLLLDIRTVLFGDGQMEPNAESCAQLTKEFFQKDTFRLLINCLPSLDSGARQNATHVIANLQRQKVNSKVIASEYLGNNLDIMNTLLAGYEDDDIAWTYGSILRECIRHQNVAKYVLESDHMKKFFQYLQNPNFDIASDVQATFKELLTRHKSTVAEFLSANYDWFFHEYNTKLLQSESYITRRHAVKLLGDILLDRPNSAVMVRYVTSLEHMRIMMNLLRQACSAAVEQMKDLPIADEPQLVPLPDPIYAPETVAFVFPHSAIVGAQSLSIGYIPTKTWFNPGSKFMLIP